MSNESKPHIIIATTPEATREAILAVKPKRKKKAPVVTTEVIMPPQVEGPAQLTPALVGLQDTFDRALAREAEEAKQVQILPFTAEVGEDYYYAVSNDLDYQNLKCHKESGRWYYMQDYYLRHDREYLHEMVPDGILVHQVAFKAKVLTQAGCGAGKNENGNNKTGYAKGHTIPAGKYVIPKEADVQPVRYNPKTGHFYVGDKIVTGADGLILHPPKNGRTCAASVINPKFLFTGDEA